jgi:DHA1 family bicyclomycin/chloramphenicol resistance-like MFS transporter
LSSSITADQRASGNATRGLAVAEPHGAAGWGTRRSGDRSLGVVLSVLTIFGPISMDLYLPVLPALTSQLGASTSAAQLTVTACLIGLAFGQLVAGPVSDRYGRRRPLLVGIIGFVAASLLCSVAPTIAVLVAARFVQGLAGAVGVVIAQAAGRDLYSGPRLLRYYGRLTVLGGLAAVVGPVVGGQLARVTDWRGTFVFLALCGALIFGLSVGLVHETLPFGRRHGGGVAHSMRVFRHLLADRVLVGAVLVTGLTNAALFAYLSGATFVMQGIYGLSPQGYSYAFALNSFGFMTFGFLASRAAERWTVRGTLVAGLAMVMLGSLGILATGEAGLPLPFMLGSLLTLVGGVAVTTPPATSLALEHHRDAAGSASALLGTARFAFGGITAPLVGLAGAGTAVPLGIVTTVAAGASLVGYWMLRQPPGRSAAVRPSAPPARFDRA